MDVVWILTNTWAVALASFVIIYFGYFLLVFILAKIKRKNTKEDEDFTPFISILIPCYNVASVIDYKIKSTLQIGYAKDKFEIIAVESGSIDDTYSKLSKYTERGNVKVIRQPKRLGKSSAINKGLDECRGEIVVVTDADAKVERNAIRELVKKIADPKVGAVVGNITIISGKSVASKMNHLFYQYFRRKPRIWESTLDSVSFCSGHLLAFYKNVVGKVDEDIINDDRYILLKTRSEGYRCVCQPSAHTYEADAEDISSQIMQKRRTTAGVIQGIIRFKSLLLNPKYGFFGTLILPFHFLGVIFLAFLLLLIEILSPIAIWTLLPSFRSPLFYIGIATMLLLGLFRQGRRVLLSLLYSIIVQISILMGIIDYLFKRHSALWTRVGSPWDEMAWKT